MNNDLRPQRRARRVVPILALLLAGCATPVPQVLPPQAVPKAFAGPIVGAAQIWPAPDWWRSFGNPELSTLIAKAQADNLDLAAAAARVMEAEAQTTIQRSALFPQIGLQGQAQRAGGNGTLSSTTISSASGNSGNSGAATTAGNSFGLTLGATYELDFWGLAHDNLRSAEETLKSVRFAQEIVALTVTSNVADNYLSVLALRQRIGIANANIAAINDILKIITLKVSTGAASHLDLAQEQAQVEAVESQLPALEEQEREALFAVAILLGQPPEQIDVKAQSLDSLSAPVVGPGLPSDLLLRRPDVAQAEANLAGAHANLDAARAAFLPQIALTGDGGFASTAAGVLLHGSNFAWDYGANLLQTIFDGGKLIGQKDLASATQNEITANYRSAVLNALSDVETSLGQVASYRRQEDHLTREVAAAREAFQISQLQYREGASDLLTVLQAQQTLFGAEDQLAQTTLARMQAVVRLYQALGGGWTEAPQDRTQTVIAGAPPPASAAPHVFPPLL
jgi:NodT family efflux transporter outer membrane factor (OMF) lipoprotein